MNVIFFFLVIIVITPIGWVIGSLAADYIFKLKAKNAIRNTDRR